MHHDIRHLSSKAGNSGNDDEMNAIVSAGGGQSNSSDSSTGQLTWVEDLVADSGDRYVRVC